MRRTSSTVSPAQPESSQQPTALLIPTPSSSSHPLPALPLPLRHPIPSSTHFEAQIVPGFLLSRALSSFLLVMLPVLPFRGCQKTFIQFCTEIHTHTHTYMETHTHTHIHAAHKSLSSAAKMPKSFHSIQHTKWHKKRESEEEQLQKNTRKKENTVKKNL